MYVLYETFWNFISIIMRLACHNYICDAHYIIIKGPYTCLNAYLVCVPTYLDRKASSYRKLRLLLVTIVSIFIGPMVKLTTWRLGELRTCFLGCVITRFFDTWNVRLFVKRGNYRGEQQGGISLVFERVSPGLPFLVKSSRLKRSLAAPRLAYVALNLA